MAPTNWGGHQDGLEPCCLSALVLRGSAAGPYLPRELAFYRCYSPHPVTLAALVKVAGLRSTIEENFQADVAVRPAHCRTIRQSADRPSTSLTPR
jgi:hypothetical protein